MMDDRMDRTIEEAAAEYHRPPEAPREEMWRRIEAARRAAPPATVLPFRRRAGRFALPIGVAALLALAFGLGRFSADAPEPGPIASEVRTAPEEASPPLAGAAVDSGPVDTSPDAERPALAAGADVIAQPEPRSPSVATPPATAADPGSRRELAAQPPESATGGSDALATAARQHLAQAESFLVLFRASVSSGQRVEPVVPATARYLLASNRLLIDSPAADDPTMRRLLGDVELVLAQISQMPADTADSADKTDETLITQSIEQRDLLLRIRSAAGDARGMPNQGVL